MRVIKSIIIVAIATISLLYAGTSEILNPKTNVYDFTYNNVQQNTNSYSNGTIIAKVAYEIESTLALLPRTFKEKSCPADSYGNRYCPEALSTASNIWTYDQSQVVEQKQYVTDYEQGNWKEFTSTVRDFMDGFASSHSSSVTDYQSGSGTQNVGTVVDYQSNSTASTYTGSVEDFTSKVNSTSTTYVPSIMTLQSGTITSQTCTGTGFKKRCTDNYSWTNIDSFSFVSDASTNDVGITGYSYGYVRLYNGYLQSGTITSQTCTGTGFKKRCTDNYSWTNIDSFSFVSDASTNDVGITGYSYGYVRLYNGYLQSGTITSQTCTGTGLKKRCTDNYSWTNIDSFSFVSDASTNDVGITGYSYGYVRLQYYCSNGTTPVNGQCATTTNVLKCPDTYQDNGTNCQKTVNYNYYSYGCPSTYTPVNSGFTSYSKTDPDTSNINDYILDDAVNSSVAPASNCKKTITYSYYNYNCPSGYTKVSDGLATCSKTDPNNTTNDESTLSQACNSSTPPDGNCTKIIPYTYYSYECSDGYTAIDKGLATCSKTDNSTIVDNSITLDDACNSATAPKENCYKDVSYKYYSYGCSAGYITDNYGLSNCPKTDPNKSINNSDSLDDACNSATPPIGNCRKEVQYSFYKYVCNGVNEFGEPYYPINSGLSSCAKTDANKNTVDGSTLDDPCNNDTVASNNCRAQAYTCNSSIITPALVNGTWQCSPYPCNSENKCGTAVCNDYAPSDTYYMPSNLSPIKAEYTGTCKGALCDAVINNKISYCQKFACPSQPGVYEKDGKCWYDECPVGTYVDANGNCVQK